MVDAVRTQVRQLAVRQVQQEQVLHQLPPLRLAQRVHGLQFEKGPAADQQVKVIRLAKILEPHVNRHLASRVRNAEGDLAVIDLLMEQTAEFAMHGEDVTHDLVGPRLELRFIHPPDFGVNANRHGCLTKE